jgi:signal peptidase I
MTDDDQVTGESPAARGAAKPAIPEDDRRHVRSEAEGALPDEKQTETSGGQAGEAGPVAESGASGSEETSESSDDSGDSPASAGSPDSPDPSGSSGSGGDTGDSGGSETSGESAKKEKKHGSFWRELPVLIGVALVLALVIKSFVVQAFYIPSQSMENTLKIGDRVLVNKIVYHTRDIHRGDVVVFNGVDSWDPEVTIQQPTNPVSKVLHAVGSAFGVVPGEKDYIKRVIGVGGDHVKCCNAQGRITVNGHPLDETSYLYTDPVTKQQNMPSDRPFDITVSKGRLWVMGDHREVSADSRAHLGDAGGGTIATDRVIGRAFVVVWPIGRWKTLPIPKTFEQPGLADGSLPAAPLALGFAGALPLTWLRRRRRRRSSP